MLIRHLGNIIFGGIVILALALSGLILLGLLGLMLVNGLPALNFDFFSQPSSDFGAQGGILYQILGSILLVLATAVITLPISLGFALFMSEFLKEHKFRQYAQTILLTLNSVPSITFGIFGLVFFVYILGTGISWLVGAIILAFMTLPIVILSTFQAINAIPDRYRENAFALGFNQTQTIYHVILPQGVHGAVTGLLIGLARAVGETAPIMFIATAFSGVSFPRSINEPVATLPTHILALAQQATNPDALQNSWGAALVLMIIVMLFSTSGLIMRLARSKDL